VAGGDSDLLEVEGITPAYLLNWNHSQLGFEGTHHKRFVNMFGLNTDEFRAGRILA